MPSLFPKLACFLCTLSLHACCAHLKLATSGGFWTLHVPEVLLLDQIKRLSWRLHGDKGRRLQLCNPFLALSPKSVWSSPSPSPPWLPVLYRVCKNPRNPGFNHYLFESVAALIRHVGSSNPTMIDTFEQLLFPAFNHVLQQ
eukprot:scaffold34956_cov17-Tisochrysis_lutea.AAC.2